MSCPHLESPTRRPAGWLCRRRGRRTLDSNASLSFRELSGRWVGGGARVRGARRQEHYGDPRGWLPWQPAPSHVVIRRPRQGGPDRRRGLVRRGTGLRAERIKAPRAASSSCCSALPDFVPRAAASPAPASRQRSISGRLRRKVSAEAAGCFPGG